MPPAVAPPDAELVTLIRDARHRAALLEDTLTPPLARRLEELQGKARGARNSYDAGLAPRAAVITAWTKLVDFCQEETKRREIAGQVFLREDRGGIYYAWVPDPKTGEIVARSTGKRSETAARWWREWFIAGKPKVREPKADAT